MAAKRVSAAEAKMHLSSLLARVAHAKERFVIERHGKAVAALVTVDELEILERDQPTAQRPLGALALLGALQEVCEAELDAVIADIYAERERDTGRRVDLSD